MIEGKTEMNADCDLYDMISSKTLINKYYLIANCWKVPSIV